MKVSNIVKEVDGRKIIDDISVDFRQKGIVFIVGKSGAGKTSLLNVITGMDNDYKGEIIVDNDVIDKSKMDRYRSDYVGVIYQDFNLVNSLSVKENICLGRKITGLYDDKTKIDEIVDKLGLDNLLDRSVEALSGGERQRVAIARALYRENRIICADEPTGNLDVANSRSFFEILKDVAKDKLCIVVSHDLEAAKEYADRIIEISDGRIVADDNMAQKSHEDELTGSVDRDDDAARSKGGVWSLHYACAGIGKRVKKQFGAMAIMILAMICVMFILGISDTANDMVESIDTTYLENDKFVVRSLDNNKNTDSLVDEVSKLEGVKQVVAYNDVSIDAINGQEPKDNNISVEILMDNDFYHKRYADIEGDFPKDNEIVINEAIANDFLGGTDVIGKTISVTTNTDMTFELKITGVRPVYSESGYTCYVSDKMNKKFYSEQFRQSAEITPGDSTEGVDIVYKKIKEIDKKEIIAGSMPDKDNEIAINISCLNEIMQTMNHGEASVTADGIKCGKKESVINNILNSKVKLVCDDIVLENSDINIVGIVDDEGKYEYDMSYAYGNFDKYFDEIPGTLMKVYVNSLDKKVINNMESIIKEKGYNIENNAGARSMILKSRMMTIVVILSMISVIIVLISAVMIHYFMKVSIIQRQYEIGVLRGLGARKKDIRSIMLFEQSVLAICVICVSSLIMSILSISGLSDRLNIDGIKMYEFKIQHIGVVAIIAFVSIILFSIKDIVKASNMNIVEALREKYKL